jgi:hypothetical protein
MEAFIKKRTARLGKDEKLERINECAHAHARDHAHALGHAHAHTLARPRSPAPRAHADAPTLTRLLLRVHR